MKNIIIESYGGTGGREAREVKIKYQDQRKKGQMHTGSQTPIAGVS